MLAAKPEDQFEVQDPRATKREVTPTGCLLHSYWRIHSLSHPSKSMFKNKLVVLE